MTPHREGTESRAGLVERRVHLFGLEEAEVDPPLHRPQLQPDDEVVLPAQGRRRTGGRGLGLGGGATAGAGGTAAGCWPGPKDL